jgi:hypothetical protein
MSDKTNTIHKPKAIRPLIVHTFSTEGIWAEDSSPSPVPYPIRTAHHYHKEHSPSTSPPPQAPKATYTNYPELNPISKAIDNYIEKCMREGDINSLHNLGRMLLDRVSKIL